MLALYVAVCGPEHRASSAVARIWSYLPLVCVTAYVYLLEKYMGEGMRKNLLLKRVLRVALEYRAHTEAHSALL